MNRYSCLLMFEKTFAKTNEETKKILEVFLSQFGLDQALYEGFLPLTSDAALRGNCSLYVIV